MAGIAGRPSFLQTDARCGTQMPELTGVFPGLGLVCLQISTYTTSHD